MSFLSPSESKDFELPSLFKKQDLNNIKKLVKKTMDPMRDIYMVGDYFGILCTRYGKLKKKKYPDKDKWYQRGKGVPLLQQKVMSGRKDIHNYEHLEGMLKATMRKTKGFKFPDVVVDEETNELKSVNPKKLCTPLWCQQSAVLALREVKELGKPCVLYLVARGNPDFDGHFIVVLSTESKPRGKIGFNERFYFKNLDKKSYFVIDLWGAVCDRYYGDNMNQSVVHEPNERLFGPKKMCLRGCFQVEKKGKLKDLIQ